MVKYSHGLGLKSKRTVSRALAVVGVLWSLVSLVAFTVDYAALFAYETAEALCLGPVGVFSLLGVAGCFSMRLGDATDDEVPLFARIVVSRTVIRLDGAVLVVALLNRI
jgi:hypothetical protein